MHFLQGAYHGIRRFLSQEVVIAILRSYAEARAACMALRNVGFGEDEVLAARGEDALKFFTDVRTERRPVGYPDDRGLPFH